MRGPAWAFGPGGHVQASRPGGERALVSLSRAELSLLVEALDSHSYWQLSEPAYRNDGAVLGEGSSDPEAARAIRLSSRLENRFVAVLANPGMAKPGQVKP